LAVMGDTEAAEELRPTGSMFSLSRLQCANLTGCSSLPVEQLICLYSAVRSIIFPTARIATQCAVKIESSQRLDFTNDAKSAAQQWLEDTGKLLDPPVACSWDKYKEFMAELLRVNKYAASLGVSDVAVRAAERQWHQAKLNMHLASLSSEEVAVLKIRCGRKGPPRLRRCFVIIRWLKIRRLEGVTRREFCMVLGKALDEPKHMLSRVYNFMDVEREGVLTQEDFERLDSFDGAASWSTVDKFREWALEFGGLKGLWAKITHANTAGTGPLAEVIAEHVDYWAFNKALQKLGWKGEANEIFALMNDHKPKTPYITADEFDL